MSAARPWYADLIEIVEDPLAPPQRPPCKPDNTVLVISADTSCDVRAINGAALPGGRCGRPGVIRQYHACEHEHLGYADICAQHVARAGETWECLGPPGSQCGAQARIVRTERIGS